MELPEPSDAEKQHSAELVAKIHHEIQKAQGWINFAEYMHLALYSPGFGYYAAGKQKFGEAGDFITAPELSPLFGQCLARSVGPILSSLDQSCVLEFGAGSGTLAASLLEQLQQQQQLPDKYLIMEVSADLRQRQQQYLQQQIPQLMDRIHWLDALPSSQLNAVVIANEVLDAMPIHRFIKQQNKINELGVSYESGALQLAAHDASEELICAVSTIEQDLGRPLAEGYQSELNLNIEPWLKSVLNILDSGVLLLIDYGYPRREYYLPERDMGTCMCYYRHHTHENALWNPGLQDITAFVDFTAIASKAEAAGYQLAGFTSQANFLIDSGLSDLVEQQFSSDTRQQLVLAQQVKTLTLPTEMGEKYKVMALTRNYSKTIRGFGLRDYSSAL